MSQYTPEVLQQAVSAVREGGIKLREAEKIYKVPFTTLRRYVTGECSSSIRGRKPKLGQLQEQELKEAVQGMADMGFGLSRNELLLLASNICMESGIEPFIDGKPSLKWYRLFKKRQNLTLKRAENISANRQKMETVEVKNEYFNNLKSLLDKLIPIGLKPHMIYNLDETGLTLVTKAGKILCTKNTKIVRQRKSGERGENITVLATVNATGSHILPPTVIYRSHSINEDLTKHAVEGTIFAHSPRSFIDAELFESWFDRFIEAIPSVRPVLLLLDGHASHLTLTTLRKAKVNQIHMLCFPPHTTHLYQPLDKSVFGPLKSAFRAEVQKLIRKNKKKYLNRYDFNRVFKPAWYKAVTPENITAGFKSCGVWPFNPEIVKLPCKINTVSPSIAFNSPVSTATTSSPALNQTNTVSEILKSVPGPSSLTAAAFPSDALNAAVQTTLSETPCYPPLQDVGNTLITPVIKVLQEFLSPEEILTTARSRRVTKSRLITSDEFIEELAEKEKSKIEKLKEKGKKRKELLEDKNNNKENSQKRKKNSKKGNLKKKAKIEYKALEIEISPSLSESEDEELCGTCKKSFQKDFAGEDWIRCTSCLNWYHFNCQKLTEYKTDFKCNNCTYLNAKSF